MYRIFTLFSASFSVVVPADPVVAHVGSTVILSCWISPPENAEEMEIRWYRQDQFNSPVLLYNQGKTQDIQECFRNRTSLSPRSDQSGGLKDGDVSLRLEKLTFQDEGPFHCYVSGDTSYDSKIVDLKITDSSGPWKALFLTFLICALLGLVLFILYKYRERMKDCEEETMEKLTKRVVREINIEELRKHGVEITIDSEHSHPDLRVSKDCKIMRDSPDYNHTGDGFPYELYASGAQRFTSGRHYWEVELAKENTPPKDYWLIGVMKDGNFVSRDRSALTASNGYWFLCSDGPHGFHINTDPPVKLSLTPRPEQLGVLLDYDDGLLSFYNVKENKHLLTISSRFSGSVVPLFSPGVGDLSALKILDCPKPVESSEDSSVVPPDPVVAHVGSTVILPCRISPPENAEALEIRWYRQDQFSNPVLLYNHGKIQDIQDESYRNRTSLTPQSDQSGGLQDGDVSLQLEKLRVQDEDSFHCYVSGESSYTSENVVLKITALGSTPVLVPKPLDDDRVNISCRSSGWYPEPSVTWTSDDRRVLHPGGSSHSRGADEMFSVHSWTAVSRSDAQLVSCSMSIITGESKESRIDVQDIVSSASFSVVVPADPVVAHVGSTVILSCWISPPENAEEMEIRWYRQDQFNSPVLLYNQGKTQDIQECFRNRTSLSPRSDQSGGLKDGDVSLRLEKLTFQDEGPFHCYVSGDTSYDSKIVDLKITALGSTPVLVPKPLDDDRVNISCRSSGWYPEPSVTWMSDDVRVLHPGGSSHSRGADEMFSVHSWTAVSRSDAQLVSCSMSIITGEFKESRIDVQDIVSSASFSVVVPVDPVVAHVGSTVILPCRISPPENAEALEIRWYRQDQFSNPVLLYNQGKIQDTQDESYRNRTSLTPQSDQSGGLQDGVVSLRLEKLRVQDEDSFHCYVSGESSYSSEKVVLKITALGSTPVLVPKPLDDDRVNISCRSSGWYPEPSVTWTSDDRRVLHPGGSSHSRGADEMFSVHSWTAVSRSDAQLVSCSMSIITGESKESRIDVQDIVSSDSSGPWKALFLTFLICALLGLVLFILYKYRERMKGRKSAKENCEEETMEKLTKRVVEDVNIEELRKHAVEITIDREHSHPDLTVSKDCKMMRDSPDYNHTGDGFPYELCAFGAQRFTSGRHYWEVELARENTPPKHYWLIGVVKDGNYHLKDRSALTPSNGYWFLCSDGPHGFHTNTDQSIIFSLTPRPEQLGVLLDYDDGLLSFYNVKESKHLLTISSRFSGSVVPLFNPGVGDWSTLIILDCPKPVESAAESSVVPVDPVVAHVGSTVILPCRISPPENAEALEIRWYRQDQFSNPVLLYNHGKIQDIQDESYRNRTSLTPQSDQSGGLQDGDVSLQLEKLRVQDEDSFHCYVSGESSYTSENVVLKITALGSTPVLVPKPLDDDRVNISCRSSGWYPEPSVTWTSDDRRVLHPGGSSHSRGADEMFSVHSWTAVSRSDAQLVSCSMSIITGESKESRIDVQDIVSSASFSVVVPADPVVAHVGSTVILSCWISPPENAEEMEIRWYRQDQFNSPVLLYNQGKTQDIQECFRNRTSLSPRSDQSGGLKDGDVSLRLEKLTFQDEGPFHCYVSGDTSYDSKIVDLKITDSVMGC
ncbi:hypothetical protein Q8A67_001597 [Cirrhinus molitorella]|uniref:Butyrophilin subfamily 1 member A1-like n=1 Tax=Cirrhinus molitorella TaxID=172907 RepID=A0AA88Q276_9TELE|nr:hypothetical protein Q8A67_001597 [Cirrhinus molitorella]